MLQALTEYACYQRRSALVPIDSFDKYLVVVRML